MVADAHAVPPEHPQQAVPPGAAAEAVPPASARRPPTWLDPAWRVAGLVVAIGLGFTLGLIGAFLAPLRVGGVYLPVSVVLALVGNPALVWFAYVTTGRRLAGLLPALAWCLVWFAAAAQTPEHDLLVASNNWVGLTTLVAGPVAFGGALYVLILRPARPASLAPTGTQR